MIPLHQSAATLVYTNGLFLEKLKKIILKFQKAIAQSTLGLGPWSIDQNLCISDDKNKGYYSKKIICIAHALTTRVKKLKLSISVYFSTP